MRNIYQTSDPAELAFAEALLRGEGIEPFVFDVHTSVIEGSIGILPRRLAVRDRDVENAITALRENGLKQS